MNSGGFHVQHMSTMIQVRNVPDELHRALKARAALEGTSMSELILVALERLLERPSRAELLERLSVPARPPLTPSAVELVRAERDAREPT
jgi:plasmid stability protein